MRKSVNIYFNNDISCKDKLETIKKIGYDEFFTGIYDKNEDMSWKDQILYGQSIGLECSMIHCSYFEPDLNYFWKEGKKGEIICDSYISQIEDCFKFTKNFVVHLNGSKSCTLSQTGLKRILKILKICEKYDLNLCVENLYLEKEIPFIFNNILHKNLKICLDYGHRNFLTPSFNLMEDYGKYVSVLHIHDNYGSKDEHLIIGKGSIDWTSVAKGLKDKNSLVLCSEIKTKESKNYYNFLAENFNGLNMLDILIKNVDTK